MELFTLIFITVTNSLPDDVRFVLYPVLKVIAHYLGLRIFEDGSI